MGASLFSDDRNILNAISLLKAYDIKDIVVSPGVSNSSMCLSMQRDKFFNIYSVVDERSAGYFAVGLARESKKPVVIMCTEATASRNYLSAMTEAYYNRIPLIAITFKKKAYTHSLQPQHIDRNISQNDVKDISIALPEIYTDEDELESKFLLNMAFAKLYNKLAYVLHIDMFSPINDKFHTTKLPEVSKIDYINSEQIYTMDVSSYLLKDLQNKKIAFFIGAHEKFNGIDLANVCSFAKIFDAIVFCDHASNYSGVNRVSIQNAVKINHFSDCPDVLIDLGYIPSDYFYQHICNKNTKVWRLATEGTFCRRFATLDKLFHCSEKLFFEVLANIASNAKRQNNYFSNIKAYINKVTHVQLPLCTTFIAQEFAKLIPYNSNLHLGIQNSIRNMNFFELPGSINVSCNTGGFGIDGAVSATIGMAENDKDKLCFLMLGDLAFFYDMNALRIRHIGNNIRILLINNNGAAQFHISDSFRDVSPQELNSFIAAAGHNGQAAAWAKSNGFEYMAADNKSDFFDKLSVFCDIRSKDKPVLFEVFTNMENEKQGILKLYDK